MTLACSFIKLGGGADFAMRTRSRASFSWCSACLKLGTLRKRRHGDGPRSSWSFFWEPWPPWWNRNAVPAIRWWRASTRFAKPLRTKTENTTTFGITVWNPSLNSAHWMTPAGKISRERCIPPSSNIWGEKKRRIQKRKRKQIHRNDNGQTNAGGRKGAFFLPKHETDAGNGACE